MDLVFKVADNIHSITFHWEAWFNSLFRNPSPWIRLFSAVQTDWSDWPVTYSAVLQSEFSVFQRRARAPSYLLKLVLEAT